jgi:hypothetical protein
MPPALRHRSEPIAGTLVQKSCQKFGGPDDVFVAHLADVQPMPFLRENRGFVKCIVGQIAAKPAFCVVSALKIS